MNRRKTIQRDLKILKMLKRYEPKEIAYRLSVSLNVVYDAKSRIEKRFLAVDEFSLSKMSKNLKNSANTFP